MVHDPDFDRVSAALHALRPGSPVDAKLAALRGLVAYWHGPIEP